MNNLSSIYGFCKVTTAPIRMEKRDASEMISQLLFGEPIEILEVENSWLKIQSLIDGYIGFVDTKQIMKVILLLDEINKNHKINIFWHYDIGDTDMLKMGEILRKEVAISFSFKEI